MQIANRGHGEIMVYRGSWDDDLGSVKSLFSFNPGWGLELNIEFPSDWHDDQSAMIRFCLFWGRMALYIPWFKRYKDHHQCKGPQFGFSVAFLEEWNPTLFLYYGNDTDKIDRTKIIYGPWSWGSAVRTWRSVKSEVFEYTYMLKSGEVQRRTATVRKEEREWRRYWLPSRRIEKTIDVRFNKEVGEKTGSWKGGVLGCGYNLKDGESAEQCLRRMERERTF